jgi:hypothetical protein
MGGGIPDITRHKRDQRPKESLSRRLLPRQKHFVEGRHGGIATLWPTWQVIHTRGSVAF